MKNFWSRTKLYIKQNWLYLTLFCIFLLFDQITKIVLDGKEIRLIEGVFILKSSHNFGAGFSILTGKGWLLILLTIVFLIGILTFNYFQKTKNSLYKWSMALIVSGAIGNLIDRIFLGYVRDFLFFELINFPIFNVADSCLTIGVFLLCVYFIFVEPKIKKQVENESQQPLLNQDIQQQDEQKKENENKS